ncbi:MAG: hypothetical protein WCP60_01160 [bacterium]
MLALLALSVFGIELPPSPQGYLLVELFIITAFTAAGILIFRSAFVVEGVPPRWEGAVFWIPFTAIFVAMVILKLGMIQFGGFDHSALIDMGWRLVSGQHPYLDFPCTMPPVFYLGAGLAFRCFGASWWSLIFITAIFAAITFTWSWFLLNKALGNGFLAWLFALLLQVSTTILVSYWWYNPITTVVASLFFLSAWCLIQAPESKYVWISYILSLSLLALSKPNIAGLLIIGGGLALLFSEVRLTAVCLSLAAGVFTIGVLFFSDITPLDLIQGYIGIAGRGSSLNQLFQDLDTWEKVLSSGILIVLLIPWIWMLRHAGKTRYNPSLWLAMVGAVSGLYGFLTNGELKLVDVFLVFIATFLGGTVVIKVYQGSKVSLKLSDRRWNDAFGIFAIILMGIACTQAITRHRVQTIGAGKFFEYNLSDQFQDTGFFAHLKTGQIFQEVYREVQSVLSQRGTGTVYFGPRMQWGYAAFGISPPLHQPSWWHPGVSFPRNNESALMAEWASHHFDLLVFLKNDLTYMSAEFIEMLPRNYSVDQSYPLLTILHRIN